MKRIMLIVALALLSGLSLANDNIGDKCGVDGVASRTADGLVLSCINGEYHLPTGDKTVRYIVHVPQPSFVPEKVYDNGTSTFIEFGNATPAELPVFFELSKDGSKVLRNYIYEAEQNRIRVNGTFQRGELRIGNDVVFLYRG